MHKNILPYLSFTKYVFMQVWKHILLYCLCRRTHFNGNVLLRKLIRICTDVQLKKHSELYNNMINSSCVTFEKKKRWRKRYCLLCWSLFCLWSVQHNICYSFLENISYYLHYPEILKKVVFHLYAMKYKSSLYTQSNNDFE